MAKQNKTGSGRKTGSGNKTGGNTYGKRTGASGTKGLKTGTRPKSKGN